MSEIGKSYMMAQKIPEPDYAPINNLLTKSENKEHKNPILTKCCEKEYRYRFSKTLMGQLREEGGDDDTAMKNQNIPYQFIIAAIKYLVHNVDSNKTKHEKGWHPQMLLVAKSEKNDYAIAVNVVMEDYLITAYSVDKVSILEYENKKLKSYPLIKKIFLEALDLDAYVDNLNSLDKKRKDEIKKKYPAFWTDEKTGKEYGLSYTKHLKQKRWNSSRPRLTLPEDAVIDILRYTMDNNIDTINRYIGESKKDKQLVVVFQNLDKSYNIGILISINDILITVISMYDVEPKDKGFSTLIFPNAKRIVLPGYDLKAFMEQYNKEVTKIEDIKRNRIKKIIAEAKETGKIKILPKQDWMSAILLKTPEHNQQSHRKIKIVKRKDKAIEKKDKAIERNYFRQQVLSLLSQKFIKAHSNNSKGQRK